MIPVLYDPVVAEEDDKAMLGQFPGSPPIPGLAEQKAIDAVMMYSGKMPEGFQAAGLEGLKGVRELWDVGPFFMQVVHRQEV